MNRTKKTILSIFILFFALAFVCAESSNLKFYWDIGASDIIYGDPTLKALHKTLINSDFTRVALSGDVGLLLELDPRIHFLVGYNVVADTFVKQKESLWHLDQDAFLGLKLYPFDSGFNFGVEYTIGKRFDFYTLPSLSKNQSQSTEWGNGFRFAFEYDFSYHTNSFAPVIGISWRNQPRGGYSDNIISFFVRLTD